SDSGSVTASCSSGGSREQPGRSAETGAGHNGGRRCDGAKTTGSFRTISGENDTIAKGAGEVEAPAVEVVAPTAPLTEATNSSRIPPPRRSRRNRG
ncbi:unnamed protein product, partial [Discosporangium mesarthrocarpum]